MRALFHIVRWSALLLSLVILSSPMDARGVVVTPARLEAQLPADGVLPPIRVENRGDHSIRVHAHMGRGSHDLQGQTIYYYGDAPNDSTFTVTPDEFFLKPGEKAAVEVTVTPADRAAYPILFIELMGIDTSGTGMTRIAVPFLLYTEASPPAGRVEAMWLEVDETDAVYALQAIVSNEGTSHMRTAGSLQLLNSDGAAVVERPLPEHVVLPGARRQITVQWDATQLSPGNYELLLHTEMALDGEHPIRFSVNHDRQFQLLAGELPILLIAGDEHR